MDLEIFKCCDYTMFLSLFIHVYMGDFVPLVRINQELYDKIQAIMKRTGWRSIGYTLNVLLESVHPEDFGSYQFESKVIIRIKKGEE